MRSTVVGVSTGLTVVALVLAACGRVAQPVPTPEPVTLYFGVPFPASQMPPQLAQALERFEQENPHITVEIVGDFFMYRYIPAAGGSDSEQRRLDAFLWMPYLDPRREDAGPFAALSLEPFISADSERFDEEDFFAPLLEAFRWGGELYALPAAADLAVLYYNRDLFDAQGVAYPQAGWDWQGFLDTAQQLTTATGEGEGQAGHWGFACDPIDSYLFVLQNGGAMLDDPFRPTRPTLDDARMPQALQWYADLAGEYGVMPRPRDLKRLSLEAEGVFATGKAAMYVGWVGERGDQFAGIGMPWNFAWGAVPLPRGEVEATWIEPWGYFVSAQSGQVQEAWNLVLSLAQAESLFVPARRALAESDAFRQQIGSGLADAALAALDNETLVQVPIVGPPRDSRLNELWGEYIRSAADLANGDITAERMIKRLRERSANWPVENP